MTALTCFQESFYRQMENLKSKTALFMVLTSLFCILTYITVETSHGNLMPKHTFSESTDDPNSVFSQDLNLEGTRALNSISKAAQRKPLPAATRGNRKLTSASYHGNGKMTGTDSYGDYIYDGLVPSLKSSTTAIIEKDKNGSAMTTSVWRRNTQNINYTNIMKLPPPNFLPQYKNPCWEVVKQDKDLRNITKLRCLPYFYLGGFPKCGTTDLYFKLLKHKQISHIKMKEPHWWTRKRFGDTEGPISSYLERFKLASHIIEERCIPTEGGCYHDGIYGDASASTLWDNDDWRLLPGNAGLTEPDIITASHIHHITPFTKIIAIVRDPVERLYSDFLYFPHDKSRPPQEVFHNRIVEDVTEIVKCISERSARACAYDVEMRLQIGMYSVFLEDWINIFSREQIHVLRLEDYSINKQKELLKIFNFLEIDSPPDSYFDKVEDMPNANTRKKLARKLGPMWPETRQILTKFYAQYNQKLAKLLQDDKYLWKS